MFVDCGSKNERSRENGSLVGVIKERRKLTSVGSEDSEVNIQREGVRVLHTRDTIMRRERRASGSLKHILDECILQVVLQVRK